ncbi:MAG TPA: fluoride efflux transporter CrcB [Flavobacterium lutivivi]|nr:fluoride efflux transporter CrcB [Flavobacterium lutivivi]
MLKTIFFIAIGGAVGSILRFLVSQIVSKFWTGNFPLATFTVNVLGCFMIGFFVGITTKNNLDNGLKWLLITGLCGGFTTFSTFSMENITLLQNNHFTTAFVYVISSVIISILSVWLGLFLSK